MVTVSITNLINEHNILISGCLYPPGGVLAVYGVTYDNQESEQRHGKGKGPAREYREKIMMSYFVTASLHFVCLFG